MLFITSRMPTVNTEPELNPNFVFDLRNNSSSRGFFCCNRNKNGAIEEIGSKNFLTAIKESQYRQVIIYIHGFSNLPEDVFNDAEEFQSLCNKEKNGELLVVPIIWPCDIGTL